MNAFMFDTWLYSRYICAYIFNIYYNLVDFPCARARTHARVCNNYTVVVSAPRDCIDKPRHCVSGVCVCVLPQSWIS